jgi:hypothetical protein
MPPSALAKLQTTQMRDVIMAARKQKMPKTTTLSVRLPFEQKEAIDKAAVEAKTTTSAYAARVLSEAATGKAPAPATAVKPDNVEVARPTIAKGIALSDPKALDELRRIGININQIAHAVNAGRPTDLTRLAQAVAKLFALLKEPDTFMARLEQMPTITLPPTPKAASEATSSEPIAPKVPAMPRQPWPEPARVEPTAKLTVTPAPERRPIPTNVYGEIATARSQQTQPIVVPATSRPNAPAPEAPAVATPPRRQRLPPTTSNRRAAEAAAANQQSKPPRHTPAAQSVTKDLRRDPPHPQARHQLQDRAPLHSPRPGPAKDNKPGRLGFLSKLWGR